MSGSDRIRLLLIDDEPDQLELMGISFERKGYPVIIEAADSPERALTLIRSRPFDCIVCNYTMPRLNGLQLCEMLRSEGVKTPFVLFTSQDDARVVGRALLVGVDDYIMKAPDIGVYDLLMQRIQRLVTQRRVEYIQSGAAAKPA